MKLTANNGVATGFALAFGVFQDHYTRLPEFKDDPNIAIIGTVATSIYFLGAPFMAYFVKRFHSWQWHLVVVGSCICVASLIVASFVGSVAGLIATQGALFGFGFLLLYIPVLYMLNEWFVRKRGLAYGVLYAGGGVSGVGLPFLLEWLLSTYGHRTALRGIAVAQMILIAPVLPLLKGRLPASYHTAIQPVDLSFLRHPLFWIFTFSNVCQGLAFYIPPLYLPTYSSAMGMPGTVGALILAANNLASVFGQVSFGHLSDRFNNVYILLFISTFVASLAAFLLWGFANSMAMTLVFAIFYGWFAGAYVVFWPKFGSILSDDPQPVYTLMAFGKGIGNMVTGPISASLLTRPLSSSGYGLNKFEPVIVFVGSLMLCSSLGLLGWPVKAYMKPKSY